jgi:hypothetical protein
MVLKKNDNEKENTIFKHNKKLEDRNRLYSAVGKLGFFSIGMVKNYSSSTRPYKSYGISAWGLRVLWVV